VLAPEVHQSYEYNEQLIARGQVAAVMTISPMLSVFRNVRQRTGQTYEIAPFPSFPSHPGVGPCMSFLIVGMSRFSRHKEEAWRFLHYLLTDSRIYEDNCKAGRNLSGRLTPEMRRVYEDFGRKNPPANYQAIWSQKRAPTPLYLFTPSFRRVAGIGWQQVQQLISGQKTVDEAMQTLSDFARLLER